MSRAERFSLLVISLLLATSCGNLMGNLRRDLDDGETPAAEATYGGTWQERGFLSESMGEAGRGGSYSSLGHSDRGPASLSEGSDPNQTRSGMSWLGGDQADENRRDALRGRGSDDDEESVPSYQSNPSMPSASKRQYKGMNGRATRADFVDESQSEGSLWASDGQTNYYFTKNKVRSKGDIVTVKLEPDMVRDFGLEIRRTLTGNERTKELMLAQGRLRATALTKDSATGTGRDQVATGQAAPDRKPAATEPDVPTATFSDIDVAKSMELKDNDPMLCEIVERYPNGNYKIRGTKKVAYKNGSPRLMTMVAVVRSADIGEDDTVTSGKLYEYRLEALR